MRKKILKTTTAAVLLSLTMCSCQKMPEASADEEILHAKDSLEDEIAGIVEADGGEAEGEYTDEEGTGESGTAGEPDPENGSKGMELFGGQDAIDCLIGTEENGIRIQDPAVQVPEGVYHMILGENTAMKKELLKAFLDSDSGEIQDLSEQEAQALVQERNEDPEAWADVPIFGTGPLYVLTDGVKRASFDRGTYAYYEDQALRDRCGAIYKNARETRFGENELADAAAGSADFSIQDALSMLLEKIGALQITEIHVSEVYMYESSDFMFYEIYYMPSWEGMGTVHDFGSVSDGEHIPFCYAWVCSEGVASVSLDTSAAEVIQKERCESVLTWEQIARILETYLAEGKIHGSSKAALTDVELVYYPFLSEDEKELELVPVWQLHVPLSIWVEDSAMLKEFGTKGAAWNICIDAVTGELLRVVQG